MEPTHDQGRPPTPPRPDAGWYADPERPDRLRWWDGESWTEHTAPVEAGPPAAPAAPDERQPGNGYSIGAIVLGVASFVFLPIVLGVIGIVLALVARSRGERLWRWGLGLSVAGTVIGTLLAFVLLSAVDNQAALP